MANPIQHCPGCWEELPPHHTDHSSHCPTCGLRLIGTANRLAEIAGTTDLLGQPWP